jgi:hypothetical protein
MAMLAWAVASADRHTMEAMPQGVWSQLMRPPAAAAAADAAQCGHSATWLERRYRGATTAVKSRFINEIAACLRDPSLSRRAQKAYAIASLHTLQSDVAASVRSQRIIGFSMSACEGDGAEVSYQWAIRDGHRLEEYPELERARTRLAQSCRSFAAVEARVLRHR